MSSKRFLLYLILFFGLGFYSLNLFGNIGWAVCQIISLLFIFYGLIGKRRDSQPIPKYYRVLIYWNLFGLGISMFSAYIFHNQNLLYSMISYKDFLFILLYFYLHREKFSIRDLEKIVIVTGFIFQIIYWIQIRTNADMFGFWWYEQKTRIGRIMFDGRNIFILSFYILLARFRLKPKSIFLFLFALFSVFILETRQLLIPALLITLFHFRKMLFKNPFVGIALFLVGVVVINYNSDIIDTLFSKSVNQVDTGTIGADRGQSFHYFLFEYNKNAYTRIFGEGFPALGSPYKRQFEAQKLRNSLSPSDIGPLGWNAFLGIIWTITVFAMTIKSFTIKVPKKYIYAKYYMANVAFTMFFGEGQFVKPTALMALAIVFYMIDKANYELNEEEIELPEIDEPEPKPVPSKPMQIA